MTLSFSAKIEIDAREKSKAIFDSINTDNKFYPENPTKMEMDYNSKEMIRPESSSSLMHKRLLKFIETQDLKAIFPELRIR